MNPFNIVKDSSIWQNSNSYQAICHKDPYIRIGMIKRVTFNKETSELKYLVQVQDRNDSIEVNARPLYRLGGAFNYEESIYRGYKFDDKPDKVSSFQAKAGDTVLVAFLNGEAREAVILGGLTHPARISSIDVTKGPQYKSEFNGIETSINSDGEYTLTFKAIPKNIKKLEEIPSKRLPKPEYDTKVGTSFLKFDKTGSIELNDKDQGGFQNIRIDKAKGSILINSGKINLTFTKKDEKIDIKCKLLNIAASDKINNSTKDYSLNASVSTKIKSPKVAIGKDGVELLDQLAKLVDMLGKVTPISPIGPCTPLISTPQWSGVAGVQSKIKEITGSF